MKNSFLFLAIAILLMAGCKKDDGSDPPIINPEEVNLIINTTLPEGLTFSALELRFTCSGVNNIPIQPGIDTISFSKEEAEELLGKNATASLVVYEPRLSDLPCEILEISELSFIVKEINYLSWSLEVKPESASMLFITNIAMPPDVTYDAIWFIILEEGHEDLLFYTKVGTDTIFVSGDRASGMLGKQIYVIAYPYNTTINGNVCFLNSEGNSITIPVAEAINDNLEWVFTLPQ